jgi:hypothetical protein
MNYAGGTFIPGTYGGGAGTNRYGFSGGGRSAIQFVSGTDYVVVGGGGGSQTAGGTIVADGTSFATAGGLGTGGYCSDSAGTGGGGYYGGGGGGNNGYNAGGGGGGSSYTSNLGSVVGSNSSDGRQAPATTSPYYISGVVAGGVYASPSGTNGGNGLVVFTYV